MLGKKAARAAPMLALAAMSACSAARMSAGAHRAGEAGEHHDLAVGVGGEQCVGHGRSDHQLQGVAILGDLRGQVSDIVAGLLDQSVRLADIELGDDAVLEAALGKYEGKKTGENSLFRTLKHCLDAGDVVVIDRYFSGWGDLALLQARGVDVVVRKHQRRHTDFREGKRLGKDDHQICWPKPPRPKWMTRKTYASLPAELTLREVRVRVTQKGFRTKELVVVTTLLDPVEYSAEEIAELYRRRWHAELNLRSVKTVLQMDHLRCKTPHRVRNEFYMHLVAYNLIRRLMAVSAQERGTQPWQVSFKGALQTVNVFLPILCSNISPEEWCAALVASVATHVVGDRPDRYEPRVKKRRAKEYDLMNKPRNEYKRQMAK